MHIRTHLTLYVHVLDTHASWFACACVWGCMYDCMYVYMYVGIVGLGLGLGKHPPSTCDIMRDRVANDAQALHWQVQVLRQRDEGIGRGFGAPTVVAAHRRVHLDLRDRCVRVHSLWDWYSAVIWQRSYKPFSRQSHSPVLVSKTFRSSSGRQLRGDRSAGPCFARPQTQCECRPGAPCVRHDGSHTRSYAVRIYWSQNQAFGSE